MYYLIWQFSVLPLKKETSNVQLIAKFWFYIYPCSNFERWTHGIQLRLFHLRKWAKTTKRLVLHDWLIGTSNSLLTGFILSEFMPLCFFFCFSCLLFLFARSLAILKVMAGYTVKRSLRKYRYTAPSPFQSRSTKKNVHLHTPVESRDRGLWR